MTMKTLLLRIIPTLLLICSATVAAQEESEGETVTLKSGLQYIDLKIGYGEDARRGDTVSVHYTGWLEDGTKFDSSLDRGRPFSFPLGRGRVIAGWDQGVKGMRVGGTRRLMIPAKLGYGNRGAGELIPPGSNLVFEVQLLAVE